MAPSWLAGRRGSDHCHPNDDNDPCNGRCKGNATEHRASDRPICCHRAELDRRQRRLGVDSGFHRCVFCQRSLWRLAYARAVRTTQIANAPGGKIFARRGAMDTGHICVGTSARHASGKSALSRTRSKKSPRGSPPGLSRLGAGQTGWVHIHRWVHIQSAQPRVA